MTHMKGDTSACLSPITAPLQQQSASNVPLQDDLLGGRPLYLPDHTMPCNWRDELEAVRQELISEHMPIVRSIARRMHEQLPAHVSRDDLYSAGVIGLLEAVDRFDPSKGVLIPHLCATSYSRSHLGQSAIARLESAAIAKQGTDY